jgi:hypothetical protein
MAARYNDAIRVVRNALDPTWYGLTAAAPELPGDPRILHYGAVGRMREYEVCREAVDQVARSVPGVRRVWLGADEDSVRSIVDEVHPYVEGAPAFAAALAAIRPDIGLAPLVDDEFDRGRSELHWLEYAMAGAATVATWTMGGGPYDVIRDGVDGMLARNRADWREVLRRLAGSRTMRQELAGRARERVLSEYDANVRAEEWADAYRWAAEHGGRGALPRLHAVGADFSALATRTATEARDALRHRQRSRTDAQDAVELLAEARRGRRLCWPDGADDHPLVSVIIPAWDRGPTFVERSIASVLAQTHQNIEVIVVGDCANRETVETIEAVGDPRIRMENLAVSGLQPLRPERARLTSGSRQCNRALEMARGQWIAPQAGGDEFTPDHIEILLAEAMERRLEFVYGSSWIEVPNGLWFRLGKWPPRRAGFAAGSVLYSAGLRFFHFDEECWREDEPPDWSMWRRMLEAGVGMGFVDRVVVRRYAEGP